MSQTVEEYIAGFPPATQELLWKVHQVILEAAPQAEAVIRYGIPTFKLNGNLVHYGGFKGHIGFYPGASGIEAFKEKLAGFKGAKGSVQFPLNQAIPFDLIGAIVRYRVEQNSRKAIGKTLRKCENGHSYHKSSDCPSCPVCEKESKPDDDFLSRLAAPARRALQRIPVNNVEQLAGYTRTEILKLHGMGPSSIPLLEALLNRAGLRWKQE